MSAPSLRYLEHGDNGFSHASTQSPLRRPDLHLYNIQLSDGCDIVKMLDVVKPEHATTWNTVQYGYLFVCLWPLLIS